jgi:hypothetical protein
MTIQVIQMFAPTELTTSAATLYTNATGPAQQVLARGRIRFANTSGSAVTVTAYAVPSGGTAGVGNDFFPTQTIPANNFVDTDVPVLPIGSFIQALASTASVVTASALDGALFS